MTSIQDLRDQLGQKHNLIACADLAELAEKHRSAFDFFQQHHQDEFAPSDRIVLYTSYEPSQRLLDHVQRAASQIDISNWFILVVCAFDIRDRLISANHRYGHDDVVISCEQMQLEATAQFSDRPVAVWGSMCPLPFMEVDLMQSQAVKPCCKFTGSIGDLGSQSLDQIFQGAAAQQIRYQMMQGQRPAQCMTCYDTESKQTTSYRQLALLKYQDRLDTGLLDSPQIQVINYMPSITCNFSCRICSPAASSTIAVEQWKHTQDPAEKQKIYALVRDHTSPDHNRPILDQLKTARTVKNLHIMGGEPFLWKELPALIDHYIHEGLAKDIQLEFNTNGSLFPDDTIDKIKRHYGGAEILVSIDNVGKRFELERGGRWQEVYENLQKYSAARDKKIKVKLAVTINIQNVLDLDSMWDLSQNLGLDGVVWWYLEDPKYLCIDHVTQEIKELVSTKYSSHECDELRAIARRMWQFPAVSGQEFLQHMALLDSRRDQSFQNTHADVYRAMGGCDLDRDLVT